MAYTVPEDWVAGEVVRANKLNRNIRDNLNYIHDALVAGQTSPAKTLGTEYQNLTGRLLIVQVSVNLTAAGAGVTGYTGVASPPATVESSCWDVNGFFTIGTIVLVVRPNYYYKAAGTNVTLNDWVETEIAPVG